MPYKRSTNAGFNLFLDKMRKQNEPEPAQTNIEKSQARVDAWITEENARKQRGEKSPFVQAVQRNLDEYSKPHSWLWWKWTFIRNRAYRIWVEIFHRGNE